MGDRLAGKVALVSGGAQGIGEAIARRFASEGAKVVIADIQEERGRATAASIGESALFVALDVRDTDRWAVAVEETARRFGGLDILVNNAGGGRVGPIEHEPRDEHDRIVDVNLTGTWAGIRAAVPAMAARGGGSIVNISSIDGLVGVAGLGTYVATKFAVTGMTRAFALELGNRGIRVNSIHPGVIETPMLMSGGGAALDRLNRSIAQQPIPRVGKPEEIANAALFFASDESSYCTGSQLLVDGGHIAGPYREPLGT